MSTDVPATVSRPDHERQILHLRQLVTTARNVAATIRRVFPVKGKVWPLKDHVATASIEVLNAMRYLEEMLYPPNQPESARQPERASEDAAARILTGPVQWKAYLNSILSIMLCHEPIWKHYQSIRRHRWADMREADLTDQHGRVVKNKDGTTMRVPQFVPRKPPRIPPIGGELLDALEQAAEGLERLVNDHQNRLVHQPPEPSAETTAPKDPKGRLRCETDTCTVTLDGTSYPVENVKAFQVYKMIAEESKAGRSPVKNFTIRQDVKGTKGHNAIATALKKLPPALQETIKTTTAGKTLLLPPLPQPKHAK